MEKIIAIRYLVDHGIILLQKRKLFLPFFDQVVIIRAYLRNNCHLLHSLTCNCEEYVCNKKSATQQTIFSTSLEKTNLNLIFCFLENQAQ